MKIGAGNYGDGYLWNAHSSLETITPDIEKTINGKNYQAGYVGKIYGSEGSGVGTLEFYRILDPSDFAELPRINAHLPENNYPIPLQKGYCFLVDIYWVDGRTASHIYRCDGEMINGMLNSHLILDD